MNNIKETRQIRIFISSTFQDMQAERDYLITKVFPRLQIEAAKKEVTIVPLDLRWGITEDESKSGKVIQICLQEIENSHPFFIGLIGNRYGWCPTKEELTKNKILKERWGEWLEQDLDMGLSVTEIEMQYGVLRSSDNLNAFFYIKRISDNDSTKESQKLKRLKSAIRNNGRYPVEEFDSPEVLGLKVEKAFLSLLNTLFPDDPPTIFEEERTIQRYFLRSRTNIYIPNYDYYDTLDQYLENPRQHFFVITSESGMGKSSLIANWLLKHEKDRNINIIYHFVGNDNSGGDFHFIQERIINEICTLYQHIKWVGGETLKDKLQWLYTTISNDKQLLIVIDGINQLSSQDNAKLMNWLPSPTSNVKYIFSTLPTDTSMRVFEINNYPMLKLQPLNNEQRSSFVIKYLAEYCKTLTLNQVNRIIEDNKNKNTFVLKTFLDELIIFGNHEKLNEQIDQLLSTKEPADFFQQVLSRYEHDYGEQNVTSFLSIIHFSLRGVSEVDIITMTNAIPLQWSQFYCAFLPHLTTVNGIIYFSHQHMRDAISRRYSNKESIYRSMIIEHFRKIKSRKAYEELCYQYAETKNYDALFSLLRNYSIFESLLTSNKTKVIYYWNLLRSIDALKYSLSAYTDIRYLKEVNKTKRANYNVIGNFILDYFNDTDAAICCFKKDELENNFINAHNNKDITPQTYYRIAQATDNIDTALCWLNKATQEYYFWKGNGQLNQLNIYGASIWYYLVEAFLLKGKLLLKINENDSAKSSINEALWLISQYAPDNNIINSRAFRTCATIAQESGDIYSCLKWLEKAYTVSKNIPYEHLLSLSQYAIMLAQDTSKLETGSNHNVNDLIMEIKRIALINWGRDTEEYAFSIQSIAEIYYHLKANNDSIVYFKRALDTYAKLFGKNYTKVANCYSYLGDIYKKILMSEQGNDKEKWMELSLLNYKEALDIAQSGNLRDIVEIYSKITDLYCWLAQNPYTSAINEMSYSTLLITFTQINEFNILFAKLCDVEGYENLEYKLLLQKAKILFSDSFAAIEKHHFNNGKAKVENEMYEEAIREFQLSLKILSFLYGEDNYQTKEPHSYLAYSNLMLGYYKQALLHCKNAMAIHEQIEIKDDNIGANKDVSKELELVITNIANILYELESSKVEQQNYQAALEYGLLLLEANLLRFGPANKSVALCHSNIGHYYEEIKDYHKAVEHYENSAHVFEAVYGHMHQSVSQQYHHAGKIYEYLKIYKKAAVYFQKALDIDEQILGDEHEYVAKNRENLHRIIQLATESLINPKNEHYSLAIKYAKDGEYSKAVDSYNTIIEEINKEEETHEGEIADCFEQIGNLYLKINDFNGAVQSFERALSHFKLEREHSEYLRAHLLGYDSFEEAMRDIEILGRDFSDELRCAELLADAYVKACRFDAAFSLLEKITSEYNLSGNEVELRRIKGDAYLAQELFDNAIEEYSACYQITSEENNHDESWAFDKLILVETAYRASGNLKEALKIALYIYNYYRKNEDEDDEEGVAAAYSVASLYEEMGELTKAEKIYKHVWKLLMEEWGEDDEDTINAANQIDLFYKRTGMSKR